MVSVLEALGGVSVLVGAGALRWIDRKVQFSRGSHIFMPLLQLGM